VQAEGTDAPVISMSSRKNPSYSAPGSVERRQRRRTVWPEKAERSWVKRVHGEGAVFPSGPEKQAWDGG